VESKYNVNLPVTAGHSQHRFPTDVHLPLRPYLVLDEVNETLDRRLAQHLVVLFIEDNPKTGGEDILVRTPSSQAHIPG
jgi:DNA replication licensing factor MCM4